MHEHEEQTVQAFIPKERRDRYRYVLTCSKIRRSELHKRLNHCGDLDPRFTEWLRSDADVAKLLRDAGCPDTIYLISAAEALDGRTMSLDEAVEAVPMHGWGTIVSCIPGKLAYYYDEVGVRRAILRHP